MVRKIKNQKSADSLKEIQKLVMVGSEQGR